MACRTCGNKTNIVFTPVNVKNNLNCGYNLDMLKTWKNLFFCIQEKQLFNAYGLTRTKFNSFLGIILSGINNEDNICYMTLELDDIKPYITQIINDGNC